MKFSLLLQRQIWFRLSFVTALDKCLQRSSYSLGLISRYSDMDKLQYKSLFAIPNSNADWKSWLDRPELSARRTRYEPEPIIRSLTFCLVLLDGRIIEECRSRYDDPQTINLSTVSHYYGICHPDYLMNKAHLDQTISRARNSSYAAQSANRWIIPSSVQTLRTSMNTLRLGQAIFGKRVLQNRPISRKNKIWIHSCYYDLHSHTDKLLLGQAVSEKSVLQDKPISKQNKIWMHSCRCDLHPHTDKLALGQAVFGKSVLQNKPTSKQNEIWIHSCRYDLHPLRASRQILNRASICCA